MGLGVKDSPTESVDHQSGPCHVLHYNLLVPGTDCLSRSDDSLLPRLWVFPRLYSSFRPDLGLSLNVKERMVLPTYLHEDRVIWGKSEIKDSSKD